MKSFIIKSNKQDNGIWGSPHNLISMDFFYMKSDRKSLIHSAVCILFSERYDVPFEISMSSEKGFFISRKDSLGTYYVNYDRYEVIENTLYEFKDDYERNIFLRRDKIKNLNKLCKI